MNGYLVWFEPYQGKGTRLEKTELGLGASVVLKFARTVLAHAPNHCHLYFDNFFTGVGLVKELTRLRLRATGTIRENRTASCPVSNLKKEQRGAYDCYTDGELSIVSWLDNKCVKLCSNALSVEPLHK